MNLEYSSDVPFWNKYEFSFENWKMWVWVIFNPALVPFERQSITNKSNICKFQYWKASVLSIQFFISNYLTNRLSFLYKSSISTQRIKTIFSSFQLWGYTDFISVIFIKWINIRARHRTIGYTRKFYCLTSQAEFTHIAFYRLIYWKIQYSPSKVPRNNMSVYCKVMIAKHYRYWRLIHNWKVWMPIYTSN